MLKVLSDALRVGDSWKSYTVVSVGLYCSIWLCRLRHFTTHIAVNLWSRKHSD